MGIFDLQIHHVISQRFGAHSVINDLQKAGLFDFDSQQNLLSLPSSGIGAAILSILAGSKLSPHSGGHLKSYYDNIETFLNRLQANTGLSLQEKSDRLNTFIGYIKYGLTSGQVYTNTPFGSTRGRTNKFNNGSFNNIFNAVDKKFNPSPFTAVNPSDVPIQLPGLVPVPAPVPNASITYPVSSPVPNVLVTYPAPELPNAWITYPAPPLPNASITYPVPSQV